MTQASIFSFFSGAGFLDLGFETSNFSIKYINESHAPFLEAYNYSRQKMNIALPEYGHYAGSVVDFRSHAKGHLRDLIKTARQSSDLIGFIGGPPCPDFSVGGKNRGRTGNTGRLSETYVDLICDHQPDFFLYENVKGLWRTAKHREFFEHLKQKLYDAGFVTTERLINAIEYGSPQDRDRIILIGFRKGLLSDLEVKVAGPTLPTDAFPWRKYAKYSKSTIEQLPWPKTEPFVEDMERPMPSGIIRELTVEHWFETNQVDLHENSEHHFTPRAGLARFLSVPEGDDSKKSFKRLHRWRYSPTVAYGNNEVHIHPYKARRLSVAEALALQSLPREFALPANMTLSNMFKTVGNGVPFLAAKGLAQAINEFLKVESNEPAYISTSSSRD